jgi:coronin-1B/1C/6
MPADYKVPVTSKEEDKPPASTPVPSAPAAAEPESSAKSLEIEQPESEDEEEVTASPVAATKESASKPEIKEVPAPQSNGDVIAVGQITLFLIPLCRYDCQQWRIWEQPYPAIFVVQQSIHRSIIQSDIKQGLADLQPKDHLLVKKLSEAATTPSRGSPLSAGYDLYSAEETTIPARGKALVDIGLSIAVPEGTYGRIAPRSGLGKFAFRSVTTRHLGYLMMVIMLLGTTTWWTESHLLTL